MAAEQYYIDEAGTALLRRLLGRRLSISGTPFSLSSDVVTALRMRMEPPGTGIVRQIAINAAVVREGDREIDYDALIHFELESDHVVTLAHSPLGIEGVACVLRTRETRYSEIRGDSRGLRQRLLLRG